MGEGTVGASCEAQQVLLQLQKREAYSTIIPNTDTQGTGNTPQTLIKELRRQGDRGSS